MDEKYVLDESAIAYVLESMPRKMLPKVWDCFEEQCRSNKSITDKQTKKALENTLIEHESIEWVENHANFFKAISESESRKLGELIDNGEFNFYNNSPELARKLPVPIPFIISIALVQNRKLVIHKRCKDSLKLQEICKKNRIKHIEVEEYLMEIRDK